jgi:hypothetical protein
MTPKEKAYELYIRYLLLTNDSMLLTNDSRIAKKCALIAVDLLISETFLDFYVTHPQPFWKEVKTELEKL